MRGVILLRRCWRLCSSSAEQCLDDKLHGSSLSVCRCEWNYRGRIISSLGCLSCLSFHKKFD